MYLSWILLSRSLHQSKGRLALISSAVAFGVLVLLTAAAFFNAFGVTSSKLISTAIDTTFDQQYKGNYNDPSESIELDMRSDTLHIVAGKSIDVIYADRSQSDNPPELYNVAWPAQGEFYASQGVRDLMDAHPEFNIGARFGSKDLGTLPYELTTGPDDLLVISGVMLDDDYSAFVDGFGAADAYETTVMRLLLVLGLVIVMFPVLLLIAISATLGSVQREARYAALRLVGATNQQVTRILLLEALLGAVIGYLVGAIVFMLVRPLLAHIQIGSSRYWIQYLAVPWWQYLLVAVATVLLVVASNGQGVRAVHTTPLGVLRRQKVTRRPRAWRAIPLLMAIGIMVAIVVTTKENSATERTMYALLGAVFLAMIGLVVVSPWIVYAIASATRRCTAGAPMMIGASYVATHSTRIARSVAGVVLALFAGTYFITAISDVSGEMLYGSGAKDSVRSGVMAINTVATEDEAEDIARVLISEPYVESVEVAQFVHGAFVFLPCPDAEKFFVGTCSNAYAAVQLWAHPDEDWYWLDVASPQDFERRTGASLDSEVSGIQYSVLVKMVDDAHFDFARTKLFTSGLAHPEETVWDIQAGGEDFVRMGASVIGFMARLVYVAMGVTLVIAIVSMLISTFASLHERRRSLLTLRLGGMRVREMVAMLLVEALAPLTLISLLATALGYGFGWVTMYSVSVTLGAHFDPFVGLLVLAALVLAVAVTVGLTPVVNKVSLPANNRSE